MPTKQNDYDLEPLLTAHQNQLGLVMSEASSIDSKALAILAIIVTLLIFIGQADLNIFYWWQGFMLIAPLCLALICSGLAIWPRHYIGPAVDFEKNPEYLNMERDTLIEQLLADADNAVRQNTRLNQIRWRYCAESIALLLLGTAALFAIL